MVAHGQKMNGFLQGVHIFSLSVRYLLKGAPPPPLQSGRYRCRGLCYTATADSHEFDNSIARRCTRRGMKVEQRGVSNLHQITLTSLHSSFRIIFALLWHKVGKPLLAGRRTTDTPPITTTYSYFFIQRPPRRPAVKYQLICQIFVASYLEVEWCAY